MLRYFPVLLALALILAGCASEPRHYSVGYTQRGFATWYGADFHGRQTANGEIYDMNAMTAASRTLPFGSIVRVTYLDTGASVDVRINDRGPFGDGDRIIDVSSAAAEVLHMKGAGVIPVTVEILSVGNGQRVKNG